MKPQFLLISLSLCFLSQMAMSQISADFTAYPKINCNLPYEVTFQNLSQGDTAWLWDFGDGNTSFFPGPIHQYATADTFTVTLIAFGPSGSDTIIKENYIITLPAPAAPILSKVRDTVDCGRGIKLSAVGGSDLVWYDFTNREVATGDTFNLPTVLAPSIYRVRAEEVGPSLKVGPANDTTVGPHGAYANALNGLQFDVYRSIVLKSVLVNARTSKTRTIIVRDTFGAILQTKHVYVPAGMQRVPLNLKLLPGNYELVGSGLEFYRNASGAGNNLSYPYELSDYLSINKAVGNPAYYYYFYDWEIGALCQSPFAQVNIMVNEIESPVFTPDTVVIDCGEPVELGLPTYPPYASHWFDRNGDLMIIGDSLKNQYINTTRTYYAKNEYRSPIISLGPKHPDSLRAKSSFYEPAFHYLEFEVYSPVELTSVLVHTSGGVDIIEVRDLAGNTLKTFNPRLSLGDNRVLLNLKLLPGVYRIGGMYLRLRRNANSPVDYPYKINNLISLTRSSGGNTVYNFFYDWHVKAICESQADSVFLQIDSLETPLLTKLSDTVSCGDSTSFYAFSTDTLHWYDTSGTLVHIGSKLHLPNVSAKASYLVRAEARKKMKVGPFSPDSLGFNVYSNDPLYSPLIYNQGVGFTVHERVLIKSIAVFPALDGIREIVIKDQLGDTIKSYSAFLKAGMDRINLNTVLSPGEYTISGNDLALKINLNGPSRYPYSIDGLIELTGSVVGPGSWYFYFYDWEVESVCYSPFTQVDVDVSPRDKVNILADTISTTCGKEIALIASSQGKTRWYNVDGYSIGAGDTLVLPFATASRKFFAVDQAPNHNMHVGPGAPDSSGMKAFFETPEERGLSFRVYSNVVLKSVLVEADSSGKREIIIRREDGSIYHKFDVLLASGRNRIRMEISFSPGKYFIGGKMLGLAGDTTSSHTLPFPFSITGVISIDHSLVDTSYSRDAVYYYFFDWEIETGCASETDSVFVEVNPVGSKPLVSPPGVSLYCPDSVSFITSGDAVIWFDQSGTVISQSDTLTRNRIAGSTSFFCQTINESPSLFGGHRYVPSQKGGIWDSNGYTYMQFEVLEDMELVSVSAISDSAGIRKILLLDGNGVSIDSFLRNIQIGPQRIPLGISLPSGDYQLGGDNLRLSFQNENIQYPSDVSGLISITGNNVDSSSWFYFFDWEVKRTCTSDYAAIPVDFVPVPKPIVGSDTVDLACNSKDTLTAQSLDQTLWFDNQGILVGRGDTLIVPVLNDSMTYYAVNETPERFYKGGITNRTVGSGSYNFSPGGLIFDVNEEVFLRSVKVYGGSAGTRTFLYQDSLGITLDSLTLFVPSGESRVNLNFLLQLGKGHQLLATGTVDFYQDTSLARFPYDIYSYLTIQRSTSHQGLNQYLYFYDWEIGDPACESEGAAVHVQFNPFKIPTNISGADSLCYETQTSLDASPSTGTWLDAQGNFLAQGSEFSTPQLSNNTSYTFIRESPAATQHLGPANGDSLGAGAYHQSPTVTSLTFSVDTSLRLNSVWVDAGAAGVRNIMLQDGNGTPLKIFQKFIPQGKSRVDLGIEFQPGEYMIGGRNLNLYRNSNVSAYPFNIPGWMSITGSSDGPGSYYYFYDWEIQEIPCKDDSVNYEITVLPQIDPFFSWISTDSGLTFSNLSMPNQASWHWDFGDGETSSLASPTHQYRDTGYFEVSLTVSNGICDSTYSDRVHYLGPRLSIEESTTGHVTLFPNPGKGRFTLEAQAEGIRRMQVFVYDMQGREVYRSAVRHTAVLKTEIDLRAMPVGTYLVRLRAGDSSILRKFIKQE